MRSIDLNNYREQNCITCGRRDDSYCDSCESVGEGRMSEYIPTKMMEELLAVIENLKCCGNCKFGKANGVYVCAWSYDPVDPKSKCELWDKDIVIDESTFK